MTAAYCPSFFSTLLPLSFCLNCAQSYRLMLLPIDDCTLLYSNLLRADPGGDAVSTPATFKSISVPFIGFDSYRRKFLSSCQLVLISILDLSSCLILSWSQPIMASLRVTPPFVYTAATILPAVCTALVVARFVIRGNQRAKVGWDDWLVLPALVKENFSIFLFWL